MAGAGVMTAIALVAAAGLLIWQIATLDMPDPSNCLARFKSNRFVGWLLFAGLVLDMLVRSS
jgi:4-hydroxybenzoate polyprenyltransferase